MIIGTSIVGIVVDVVVVMVVFVMGWWSVCALSFKSDDVSPMREAKVIGICDNSQGHVANPLQPLRRELLQLFVEHMLDDDNCRESASDEIHAGFGDSQHMACPWLFISV